MRQTVMLIGFQDQGNLGIGYLAATLTKNGYSVQVVDFRQDPDEIVGIAKSVQPILIGFSLIFQYYLPGFARLASYLRAQGIECHFTIGGHYPSLCHEDVLEAVPEVDSVVRFEGEITLLELVECLTHSRNWRDVCGIAYRQNGAVTSTSLRPFIHDLDQLPYPYRPLEPEHVLGNKALPILGSRGCARTCSFCSIHTFYRSAPGKVVRTRNPANIVQEMKDLYNEQGISIFLFQDDDFPLWGKPGQRWVSALVDELERRDLMGRVIWKISCRAEYVQPALFARLRQAGLYLVYMGLESGTEAGLKVLNKRMTVEQNLRAVAVLKALDLMFEYGFMLFDPSSTFESVRANVSFLRQIVGDGSAAATFCRMLPYGGTPIRERLAREERLKGDVTHPDYDFLDPRLNAYFESLNHAVNGWIHGDGVSHQLNWAWHEVGVIQRLFPPVVDLETYKAFLRSITKASNELLFTTIEESSLACERDMSPGLPTNKLESACRKFAAELLCGRNAFMERNQDVLLGTLIRQEMSGPIVSPQIF